MVSKGFAWLREDRRICHSMGLNSGNKSVARSRAKRARSKFLRLLAKKEIQEQVDTQKQVDTQ